MTSVLSLPSVFAIYDSTKKEFIILECEVILNGVIFGLKYWVRPVKSLLRYCKSKQREDTIKWFQGEQWYVVPFKKEEKKQIHYVNIQNKKYIYWYLEHSLLWVPHDFGKRPDLLDFKKYKSIPLLEFNMKKLYKFDKNKNYVKWYNASPDSINQESVKGWRMLYDYINSDIYDSSKTFRIRTPLPRSDNSSINSDNSDDSEKEDDLIVNKKESFINILTRYIKSGVVACSMAATLTFCVYCVSTIIGY